MESRCPQANGQPKRMVQRDRMPQVEMVPDCSLFHGSAQDGTKDVHPRDLLLNISLDLPPPSPPRLRQGLRRQTRTGTDCSCPHICHKVRKCSTTNGRQYFQNFVDKQFFFFLELPKMFQGHSLGNAN